MHGSLCKSLFLLKDWLWKKKLWMIAWNRIFYASFSKLKKLTKKLRFEKQQPLHRTPRQKVKKYFFVFYELRVLRTPWKQSTMPDSKFLVT